MSEFYDLPTIVSVCNRWATSIDTNDFVKLRHDSDVMIKLLDELQAVYWAFKYDALEVLVENLDSHFQRVIKVMTLLETMAVNNENLKAIAKNDGLKILMNMLVQIHRMPDIAGLIAKELLRIIAMAMRNTEVSNQITKT